MLRTTLASSRVLRVCVLGLVTFTTAIIFTTDSADARRYRHRHMRANTIKAREQLQPAILPRSSSTAIPAPRCQSNNPDASRHPASLTKIMTLYLLFERLEPAR